jgi:hypothetical protein
LWIVKCKKCGAPLSLRSSDLKDAFTQEAMKLRRKYRGKLVLACDDFPQIQLCQKCFEKKEMP